MRALPIVSKMLLAISGAFFLHSAIQAEQDFVEFPIGAHGRPLIVPVQIGYTTVQCLVDTGAAHTTFDTILRGKLGQARGLMRIETPSGTIEIPQYDSPPATVGPFSLNSESRVLCWDLSPLRMATGEEVYGVLGMDFLRRYIVTIDFDKGRLSLATTDLKPTAAVPIPIRWQQGCPVIALELPESRAAEFRIDTGANVCTLKNETFQELARNQAVTLCRSSTGFTATGQIQAATGFLSQIRLRDFSHQGIRVDSDRFNAIGLSYLSRYNWTFDFPHNQAYLVAGQRFDQPEPIAASGISVATIGDQKVILGVSPRSPAAGAGLLAGDVIQAVDGQRASSIDMYTIGQILTSTPGQSVDLDLERQGKRFHSKIVLGNRLMF